MNWMRSVKLGVFSLYLEILVKTISLDERTLYTQCANIEPVTLDACIM